MDFYMILKKNSEIIVFIQCDAHDTIQGYLCCFIIRPHGLNASSWLHHPAVLSDGLWPKRSTTNNKRLIGVVYTYNTLVFGTRFSITWWCHQMGTFSALLAILRGIHRSPVNSPHKGQWRAALMFSLIFTWMNGWVSNREAGDLRRDRAHMTPLWWFWVCKSMTKLDILWYIGLHQLWH